MPNSVQRYCEQRELSVPALAELSGLDVDVTLAIVHSRRTPSPTERQQIAAALGVTIDDIMWGHATPIQHLWGS
jgi:hypothetical protein